MAKGLKFRSQQSHVARTQLHYPIVCWTVAMLN